MEDYMKKFIIDFIKDRSFQTTVIGGIVVLIVWTIMQWLLNILSGLDFLTALKGAIDFSETKVSITWLLIVVGLFSLLNSFSIYSVRKNLEKKLSTKDELNKKLKEKLDASAFYSFHDVYDYRRLKNHPYHEMYTGHANNIRSFIQMIDFGIDRLFGQDGYSIDNGICGLIAEIKEQKYIHNSDKSEILNLLAKYKKDEYDAKKEELIMLLNEIETI